MAEQNENQNKQDKPQVIKEKADQAYRFLSDALRASFTLLKIIMVVLVAVFLFSGFQTIGPYEEALVLTFGKISGEGEKRVLKPGLTWVWPYPIQEIVRIPVEKKINVALDSMWYYESAQDKLANKQNFGLTLNPLVDGYCLTRGESSDKSGSETDYNIVHTKWQMTYQIADPEQFFKHTYVDFSLIEAGQNYADVIEESTTPMLRSLLADAVISTLVDYTIDDVLFQQLNTITDHVTKSLQAKLDQIQSGIKVVSIQLVAKEPPRQVADAFWANVQAANAKETAIKSAQAYRDKLLNEAGGPAAAEILAAVEDTKSDPNYAKQLWSQLAGEAQETIAKAQAYRTRVVENAKANADYFRSLLPEYRKTPTLVVQQIWQDTVQDVLDKAEEKTVIQPATGKGQKEIRVLINRNPNIKEEQAEKTQAK
jgi:membrane protease subunit HflK